jgi:hydrogenase maturation protease
MTESTHSKVLALGIGNVLWADEGFGTRAAEALHAAYELPPEVRVMDGGTQGMFLLPYVRGASRLLIFDAIDFGLEPGELRLIRDDDVPSYMGAKKVSMHQTGFQEVLASARLLGDYPQSLALIGVQPVLLDDYGGSLQPQVKARIPDAISLAVGVLREWGVTIEARRGPLQDPERISPTELEMAAYEEGRAGTAKGGS